MKTKQRILMCALELASENGMGNVTLQKIADKVGVRKATLFSHYKSKDEIFEALYQYLRETAMQKRMSPPIDYIAFFEGKSAVEVLEHIVLGYKQMNENKNISAFYKFIYTERVLNPMAAKIMIEETETMLDKTRELLSAMQEQELLTFPNLETAVTSFCLTIHELLDLERDYATNGQQTIGETRIKEYISGFCAEYSPNHQARK